MSGNVLVGEIVAPFGVKGWVKVRSFTDPPANILKYVPWTLTQGEREQPVVVLEGRLQGTVVAARLEGVEDRDQAIALRGMKVTVPRGVFPRAPKGHYYWADLVGLRVYTVDAIDLGVVTGLLETGANDVLEVKGDRERLIPFVMGPYVKEVDLDAGRITVDWDPEF
ncbi:MAG: ribosome maturation factor RimM [Pseudomonadota bacterium]|jgi:16S rRNA processing protein RimM